LHSAEEYDAYLTEDSAILTYMTATTPDISHNYAFNFPDVNGMGGPTYIQLQERVAIQATDHSVSKLGEITNYIDTTYPDSSNLEFYFYRQPFVKKIEPTSGLAQGGTIITVTGGWFMQMPEYGVYPFCKIGDSIIRARYVQSNRILCKTPATTDLGAAAPVSVSLNGVDWVETGFSFSYYEKPIMTDLQPRSGSVEGGTEIWIKGSKFSNITHGLKTVKCRFRQIMPTNATSADDLFDEENVPTKFIPAYYINAETMKCASPTGWVGGDQVKVDLTFNGVDYTDQVYTFSFYSIYDSFPKSGPATGINQYIQIRGKGFRTESTIICVLNGTEISPIKVKQDVIKCPMVLASWPSDKYESVNFHILIDGSKRDFGSFHYYKQIEITDVSPLLGPNEG
jgi:hypothetical protein